MKKTLSKKELEDLKDSLHPTIVSGGYLTQRLDEYQSRPPLTDLRQAGSSPQRQTLGICNRCNSLYEIRPEKDIFFEPENEIQIPYCEPCAITKKIKEL